MNEQDVAMVVVIFCNCFKNFLCKLSSALIVVKVVGFHNCKSYLYHKLLAVGRCRDYNFFVIVYLLIVVSQ